MINHLDHFVITTADESACIDFYTRVLGMKLQTFMAGNPPAPRKAFAFGHQKINLHVAGAEFSPRAAHAAPGSQDLCFMLKNSLDDMVVHLAKENWPLLMGPVPRAGATGPIRSVYLRDPDDNLVELCEPLSEINQTA